MTLRFDWYPRLENQDIAAKADIVINQLIKTQTHRRTKSNIELTTKQILNALYCSYFSLPKGSSQVSISLTSGHYTNTEYSYRIVKDVFNCLCELKWIEFEKGNEDNKKNNQNLVCGRIVISL